MTVAAHEGRVPTREPPRGPSIRAAGYSCTMQKLPWQDLFSI